MCSGALPAPLWCLWRSHPCLLWQLSVCRSPAVSLCRRAAALLSKCCTSNKEVVRLLVETEALPPLAALFVQDVVRGEQVAISGSSTRSHELPYLAAPRLGPPSCLSWQAHTSRRALASRRA